MSRLPVMQVNRYSGKENQPWSSPLAIRSSSLPSLVTRSLPMRRIAEQIPQVTGARLLLLEGEAGTGKQYLARYIGGLRRVGPRLVAQDGTDLFPGVNALPGAGEEIILGAAQQAAQGILLIRNVDELARDGQMELLHFIRSYETALMLGASNLANSPTLIICTARQSLRSLVLAETFLPELYYRLNAVSLSVPALRERKEDIPALAQNFIDAFAREHHRPLQGLGPGALAVLLRHRWPGNVRELESVIRAACFSVEGQWLRPIDLILVPLEAPGPAVAASPSRDLNLDSVIRRHVQHVLKVCEGNKARAASRLGISRSTLYRMLESDPCLPAVDEDLSSETAGVSESESLSQDSVVREVSIGCAPSR